MTEQSSWRAVVRVPKDQVGHAEEALISCAPFDAPPAISSFESARDKPMWDVEAVYAERPDRKDLVAALGDRLAETLVFEELAAVDWIAEALKHHQPVDAGRFHIRGRHHPPAPPGGITLRVEATTAFGTGQHGTTLGCLKALDALGKSRSFQNMLDLGCGTGILAMAMARLWPGLVSASDIDAPSLRIARENARDNGLHPYIRFVCADGLKNRVLSQRAPYDLIVANILAGPLKAMAPDMARALRPRGIVVLSGLLKDQERTVRAVYRSQGLTLLRRIPEGEWMTLILGNGTS